MSKTEASPSSGEARGLKHESLLIAAAPALLEACIRTERYLQGIRSGRQFEEGDLVDIIKAAIRKATADLDRPGQDAITFDSQAKAGERFQ